LQKLVTNDHDREIIETMQSSLLQSTTVNVSGQPTADYITKEEFDEFKADIREHFRTFINNARAKGATDGTILERQKGE